MFKKISSNRDPNDTLVSEIKKEFPVYFDKAGKRFGKLLRGYPWQAFSAMIFILLLSVILSLTVLRYPVSGPRFGITTLHHPTAPKSPVSPVTAGFGSLLATTSAIKEMISLKKEVDSLTAKGNLTRPDSARLEKVLDRLQQINEQIKSKP